MDECRLDILSHSLKQNETGDDQCETDTKCISRIPDHLLDQNSRAYVPQVVSFGPFHYANSQLAKYESVKEQFDQHLPYKARRPPFKKLVDDIISQKIKIHKWYLYAPHKCPLKDELLGRMMARDSLLLLGFLREMYATGRRKPAHWSGRQELSESKFQVHEDIMKLENQMPLFVVKMVLQWEAGTDQDFNSILRRACHTLCPFPNIVVRHDSRAMRLDSHLLEFMYENIIGSSDHRDHTEQSRMWKMIKSGVTLPKVAKFGHNRMWESNNSGSRLPPTAELNDRGVKFVAQPRLAFNEICFDDRTCTFYLPTIEMDGRTDTVMRNLLAFEALVCREITKPLMCYMYLMERLINKAEDVKVLRDSGIIYNQLCTDEEVATVWNGMGKVLEEKGEYGPIDTAIDGITVFCESKYRNWYAQFKKKCFSRPWLVVAVMAGSFSLLLSLLQTILAWEQVRLQLNSMRMRD